jgi:hypothetical protein
MLNKLLQTLTHFVNETVLSFLYLIAFTIHAREKSWLHTLDNLIDIYNILPIDSSVLTG